MMYDQKSAAHKAARSSSAWTAEHERRANLLEETPDPTLAPRRCVWRCTDKRPSGQYSVWTVAGTLDDVQRARRRNELVLCEPVTLVSIVWERDL
jgi:hypothetical protein